MCKDNVITIKTDPEVIRQGLENMKKAVIAEIAKRMPETEGSKLFDKAESLLEAFEGLQEELRKFEEKISLILKTK